LLNNVSFLLATDFQMNEQFQVHHGSRGELWPPAVTVEAVLKPANVHVATSPGQAAIASSFGKILFNF